MPRIEPTLNVPLFFAAWRPIRLTCYLLVICFLVSAAWAQSEYEPLPTLKASEILPESLLKGDLFEVEDLVTSDGLWNIYVLRTRYADYKLHGTYLLADRIHEIQALAELKKMDEGVLVAQGALDSMQRTEENLVQTATHPVETVEALGKGLRRIFGKVQRGMDDLGSNSSLPPDEGTEQTLVNIWKMGKDFSGISRTERALARKVGVDPYTPSEDIRKELQRLAFFEAAGDIAVSSFTPIPRPIGLAISVSGLAWNEDPEALRELNVKRMEEMGVSEPAMQEYLSNHFYTLSGETQLIEGLHSLGKVPGQEGFLVRAGHADSYQLATFFLLSAALMKRYHEEDPILEILPETVSAAARLSENRVVVLFPADHVAWTEELGPEIQALNGRFQSRHPGCSVHLRLTGTATELFRKKVAGLGWTVEENTASYESLVTPQPSQDNN